MDGADLDGRPIKVKVFKSYENYKKEKEAEGYSPGPKHDDSDN